ncbi:hypothetical protein [Streptosporangium sp. CA-115845]|uniref:hypothetical protein n=1 Tax=Streptosporangium sp. CA-115845 TaxID=3240071 RepID=UPI003D939D7F
MTKAHRHDAVMDRVLADARREFPDFEFDRVGEQWRATSGQVDVLADSVAALCAELRTGQAVRRAKDLAAVLAEVHHIRADVHELASGNAILSVHYGLVAYTDGEKFWWTSPELSESGSPLLSSALTLKETAAQLAEHHTILRAREAVDVVRSELPLLADVILAEHVDPR